MNDLWEKIMQKLGLKVVSPLADNYLGGRVLSSSTMAPTSTPTMTPSPTLTPTPTRMLTPTPMLLAEEYQSQVPLPTPTIRPDFANVRPDVQAKISEYFPGNLTNEAINTFAGESSLRPDLIHQNLDESGNVKTTDYGLAQINDYWQRKNLANMGYTPEDMLNLDNALKFAAWLYSQQGWNPWYGAPEEYRNR